MKSEVTTIVFERNIRVTSVISFITFGTRKMFSVELELCFHVLFLYWHMAHISGTCDPPDIITNYGGYVSLFVPITAIISDTH